MRAFGHLDEVTSSIWSATRASFLPSNLKTFAITSWACAPPGAKLRTSGSTFLSVPQSGSARAISAALAGELSSGDNQRCASVAQSFVDQAAQRMSRRADEIPTEAHRRFGKCDQFSPSCVPADPAAPSTAGIWQTSRAECVGCAPVAGRAARSRKCANVAGSASPASSCIDSVFCPTQYQVRRDQRRFANTGWARDPNARHRRSGGKPRKQPLASGHADQSRRHKLAERGALATRNNSWHAGIVVRYRPCMRLVIDLSTFRRLAPVQRRFQQKAVPLGYTACFPALRPALAVAR